MTPDQREISKLFIRIFFGTLVLVMLLGWAFYAHRLQEADQTVRAAGLDAIHAIETRLHDTLEAVRSDLLVLGRLEEISRAFASRDLNRLTREFLAFSADKKIYDQIRCIDERGQEVARVELLKGQPRAVPRSELQNKTDRYYFKQAMILGPREIYVAPMDLGVERGEIELPYKPVLRFATPVFDRQGIRRGIVVLDYTASLLLDAAADIPRDSPGRLSLLNKEGYWLRSPRPADEWGFMFPERRDVSFAARHPEAWHAMERVPRGEHAGHDGRFFFTTIPAVTRVSRSAAAPDQYWKLVYHVAPQFYAARQQREMRYAIGLGALILLLAVPWQWYAARSFVQGRQHAAAVAEREADLGKAEQIAGLGHWTYPDALTELPNRMLLGDRLAQALVQAHRHSRMVGVMSIDLDGFKQVNDSYGHDMGDLLLKEVAARLNGCVRAEDTVARLDGDQFAILLPNLSAPEGAAQVAKKALAALEQPLALNGHIVRISGSLGIAVYPRDAKIAEELLKQADQAMRHAKKTGGRRFCFYRPAMADGPVSAARK